MNIRDGMTLGPYRVIERIGRGGMATVHRAYHPGLDRYVAIKVLPDFFADDPGYRERFQQEARSVARLKHPNILEVFDFGYEEGLAYLVLELVEGGTLEDRVGSPMELRDVVRILEQLAGALDHAHAHGILHRDLKPSNILLHKDGTPVLADFGLAMMAGSVRRLTSSGTVMGTPEYMSPEQAADEAIGPASDLYSFAIVAYEMLTGRVPFGAVDLEWGRQRCHQPFGGLDGVRLGMDVLEENPEFVPSKARHGIGQAGAFPQALRQPTEHGITRGMAQPKGRRFDRQRSGHPPTHPTRPDTCRVGR